MWREPFFNLIKMSNRLDKETEARLQPKRMETALTVLKQHNPVKVDDTQLTFTFKGNTITYFPYSGWHQGKGIKAGRGLINLLKQLI